jgi:Na+-transporting methylmalonyl-CoA/oxaloacetate decarboxylase gamma subunit
LNAVTHGLVLTVVGMGLVFLALGIFLVSMVVLTRLFPGQRTRGKSEAPERKARPSSSPSEAELAAIGAALAVWLYGPTVSVPDPQLGSTLTSPLSPWGTAARGTKRQL